MRGVKIALIGVTTPAIPSWEKPEHFRDYRFRDAVGAVEETVSKLRAKEKPDLIIVAAHFGLERDPKTGATRTGGPKRENAVHEIATRVAGIDAIVFGHTHQQLEDARINGVLLIQPKNWGMSLGRIRFTLESNAGGGYRVLRKSGKLIPVTNADAADPAVLKMAAPYHEVTEQYLNSPVTRSPREMNASESRIEDTPIIDAVHRVQLQYAEADVSFASSFNPRAAIPKGPVTVRQIAALYIYDNELYAIEGTGKMVKDALENSARFYRTCPTAECTTGPLLNRAVIGYNYDMAQGVTYDVDLSRRPGNRIQNLRFRGEPLKPDQKLRIAVNNYRYGGSAGYSMFKGAPILWRSYEDIRELIIRYYASHPLPESADKNWRIVPAAARQVLRGETQVESNGTGTQCR
jgi:2',3'-cyclic-nucleotide 2'-phosphodiesterase/3'-nucleotidase